MFLILQAQKKFFFIAGFCFLIHLFGRSRVGGREICLCMDSHENISPPLDKFSRQFDRDEIEQ